MKKRILYILLAVFLTGSFLIPSEKQELLVSAKPDEEDTEELEQKRQDALDEIDALKSDISTVEQKIKDLKNNKSNLQSYINQLDGQVNKLASQISGLENKIEAKNGEIEAKIEEIREKQEELSQAEEDAEDQYDKMKMRIRCMYEAGEDSFLVMLLESGSIAEMMNRAEVALQMSVYDRQMMEKLEETRADIEKQKNGLEAAKGELETEKAAQEKLLAEVESQKSAVNRAINAKTQEIASYQDQINSASGDQAEYQKQLAEQEKLLDQIESQIAAAAAAKGEQGDGNGAASGFLWPCPASRRITSYFGPRKAPVAGASTYHKGIDVGASSGSAIVASAAGRVTTSTYSSSAGNYVVISHGDGISTVYMHASALYRPVCIRGRICISGAEDRGGRFYRIFYRTPSSLWCDLEWKLCKSSELCELTGT